MGREGGSSHEIYKTFSLGLCRLVGKALLRSEMIRLEPEVIQSARDDGAQRKLNLMILLARSLLCLAVSRCYFRKQQTLPLFFTYEHSTTGYGQA